MWSEERREVTPQTDKAVKLKKKISQRNRPGRPKGVQRKRIVKATGQNNVALT